jgi:hypothetical protein
MTKVCANIHKLFVIVLRYLILFYAFNGNAHFAQHSYQLYKKLYLNWNNFYINVSQMNSKIFFYLYFWINFVWKVLISFMKLVYG